MARIHPENGTNQIACSASGNITPRQLQVHRLTPLRLCRLQCRRARREEQRHTRPPRGMRGDVVHNSHLQMRHNHNNDAAAFAVHADPINNFKRAEAGLQRRLWKRKPAWEAMTRKAAAMSSRHRWLIDVMYTFAQCFQTIACSSPVAKPALHLHGGRGMLVGTQIPGCRWCQTASRACRRPSPFGCPSTSEPSGMYRRAPP